MTDKTVAEVVTSPALALSFNLSSGVAPDVAGGCALMDSLTLQGVGQQGAQSATLGLFILNASDYRFCSDLRPARLNKCATARR